MLYSRKLSNLCYKKESMNMYVVEPDSPETKQIYIKIE